jgi:hypothetical protein
MRNSSEYKQIRPILSAAGDGSHNMFIPSQINDTNPISSEERLEKWRSRYSEQYNKKWGRAQREKVVKEVDTFGGKYEEPLIQNR